MVFIIITLYVIIDETMKDKKYLLAVNPDENHAINMLFMPVTRILS